MSSAWSSSLGPWVARTLMNALKTIPQKGAFAQRRKVGAERPNSRAGLLKVQAGLPKVQAGGIEDDWRGR